MEFPLARGAAVQRGLERGIGSFCISAGRAMEHDLQAKVAILWEELEILKRAFDRRNRNAF
jgi:hypothetical protein